MVSEGDLNPRIGNALTRGLMQRRWSAGVLRPVTRRCLRSLNECVHIVHTSDRPNGRGAHLGALTVINEFQQVHITAV